MREVFIIDALRTPIGKFLASFRNIAATRLGGYVISEIISRSNIQAQDIDEVIMGNVISSGLGQAPARQAAVFGGVPFEASALTINKVCGSGLKAVMLASQGIKLGDTSLVIAGGMENMSMAPYIIRGLRSGVKSGDREVKDLMIHDGLWDVYNDFHMGMTGETVSEMYAISREEQDSYAFESYRKAMKAIEDNSYKEQIVPVIIKEKGRKLIINKDEEPRDTTLEALAKLSPAFKKNGTVTAGNAPGVNDAAAALLLAGSDYLRKTRVNPMAKVIGYSTSGIEPKLVMMAPVSAIRILLKKTCLTIDDIDLIEVNEAFSSAAIAIIRELNINPAKVNIYGGAVALGHPIGATGAILLVKLVHALKEKGLRYGLASLCLGGGNAVAVLIENMYE